MTEHRITKVTGVMARPGEGLYRGIRIARNDDERGDWDHWYAVDHCHLGGRQLTASTRRILMAKIDQHLRDEV